MPLIDEAQLEPGRWYAVGMGDEEGRIDWASAPLLRYEGAGCWSDEAGEVEEVFDPFLQAHIPPSAAEQLVEQNCA